MGQGEGVKGAREKGDLRGAGELKRPLVQPPQGDESVDMGQGGGPVEEGQAAVPRGLLCQEKELTVAQGKEPGLLLHVQDGGLKEELASHQQGLLPHCLPIVGQPLEKQSQQLLPPALVVLVRLRKAIPVGGIVL